MIARYWLLVLVAILVVAYPMRGWASGELHLTFHMGGVAGGKAFVGGTLLNSGDATVAHGYVVVTLLDTQCRPLKSVLESFGPIEAGERLGFRVPVGGGLQRYRLLGFKAFDAQGFEVPAVDDNQAILKARESEERTYCTKAKFTAVGS